MLEHRVSTELRPELTIVPEPDDSLAVRAASDPAALTELYRRYVDQIFGFCLLQLGNRQLAEDCTSQVFTQVIEALPRFQPEQFRAWIFTIARRVVIDAHRRARPSTPLDDAGPLPLDQGDLEEGVLWQAAGEELRRYLDQLSAGQQAVIELRLAGLTGPEIRDTLGKSRAWVDTTQYRAVQRLRTLMLGSKDEPR
jgi:RNA polymerase sigma-70 factor (ECF subfamily)